MGDLLHTFRNKHPEIVFEWDDPLSEARGWVVINSLRGGASGGGTRMRKGLNRHEVESLAKIMEIKFTVSGPSIGGAKSGIDFDPSDPRKEEVLNRWFHAVIPLLKNYYGTGGDLNINEVKEVVPITEDYGLWHPQEGIVTGYFQPLDKDKIHILGQLRQGVSKKLEDPRYSPDISRKYLVADMTTGYGVAQSVKHFYDIFKGQDLHQKRVIIQGWGNVASSAAYYMAQAGAVIVGVIDRSGGIISEEGLGFQDIKDLFLYRKGNLLAHDDLIDFETAQELIWEVPADIFIPGAASRLVDKLHIEKLVAKGLEVIACGANAPFIEEDVFFGKTSKFLDDNLTLIPDFIANCGMARVFAYLMQIVEVEISDEAIFEDISLTIYNALQEVYQRDKSTTNIAHTALDIALEKLIDKKLKPV